MAHLKIVNELPAGAKQRQWAGIVNEFVASGELFAEITDFAAKTSSARASLHNTMKRLGLSGVVGVHVVDSRIYLSRKGGQ